MVFSPFNAADYADDESEPDPVPMHERPDWIHEVPEMPASHAAAEEGTYIHRIRTAREFYHLAETCHMLFQQIEDAFRTADRSSYEMRQEFTNAGHHVARASRELHAIAHDIHYDDVSPQTSIRSSYHNSVPSDSPIDYDTDGEVVEESVFMITAEEEGE